MIHQGKALEHYIRSNNLKIKELTEKLNVSRTQFYKYFTSQELEESTKKRFEQVLGTTFAEIGVYYLANVDEQPKEAYIDKRRAQKIEQANPRLIPFLPYKARAGYIQSYEQADYIEGLEKYPIPPGVDARGYEWRWFEVGGDSMEPVLFSGDIVLCSLVPSEDWPELKNFLIYVIVLEQDIFIKRVAHTKDGKLALISENAAVSQTKVDPEQVKEIWKVRRQINAKLPPTKKFEITV